MECQAPLLVPTENRPDFFLVVGMDQQWMLLVLSALVSMVISYFVLARFREESTRQLQERVERRTAAAQAKGVDETAEDAEDDRTEYR